MRTSTFFVWVLPTLRNFVLLNHAQQPGLHLDADIGNFIQEKGSAIGELDLAERGLDRPENAPLTWPNSSLSKRLSTSVPQSTVTNGLPERRLRR